MRRSRKKLALCGRTHGGRRRRRRGCGRRRPLDRSHRSAVRQLAVGRLRAQLGAFARSSRRSSSRRARIRSTAAPRQSRTTATPVPGTMVPALGSNVEAKKTSRTRTRTSSSRTGSPAPTRRTTTALTSSSRATRAARPGRSRGSTSTPTRAHRVTLLATKDAIGNDLRDDRRLYLGPVGEAAAVHDRERRPRRPTRPTPGLSRPPSPTSRARSDAAGTRASRTTPPATSGSSRTSAARRQPERPRSGRTASSTASCRRSPATCPSGKLQVLQVLDGRRPRRSRPAVAGHRSAAPTTPRCTSTARAFYDALGDDPRHGIDGNAPFNANALAKAADGDAVQAARERSVPAGLAFKEFYFDETGDTNATSAGERRAAAAGARSTS